MSFLVAWLACATAARAQLLDRAFQSNVPGFDQQRGLAPLAESAAGTGAPPVHLAGLTILADLQESIGYNSNLDGTSGGPGSAFLEPAPSVSVEAAGPRGRAGLDLTLDDQRYFTLPLQDRTNWTVALGGTYALGRDFLTLGYAHLDEHEVATELAQPASAFAIPYQSDDFRALYAAELGRAVITPNLEFTTLRYGGTAAPGAAAQSFENRNVFTGGATALFPIGIERNLVVAVQDVQTDYLRRLPGTPDLGSNSVLALGGLDYRGSAVWRYRLLLGVEERSFSAPGFASIVTPVAAASAIFTPTHLTALTATVSREIEDAAAAGVGSYTDTDARLVLDHRLHHDVFLQLRGEFEAASYQTGGTQLSGEAGGSATWQFARRWQLRLDYDYRRQGGVSGLVAAGDSALATAVSSQFSQSLVLLTLRIAL